jgi:uncharacterized repeat protein (TIGR01451 family)
VDTPAPVPSLAIGAMGDGFLVPFRWGAFPGSLSSPSYAARTSTDEVWSAYLTYDVFADVAVTKKGSPDSVRPGGQLTYTITVSNAGPGETGGVTVSDPLPAGVAFVSVVSARGSCLEAAGNVTCDLGTLAAGENAVVTLAVTAPSTVGAVSNTATIVAAAPDPDTANNSATAVNGVGDMLPAALRVDTVVGTATISNINGVLEPLETVVVAPSWHNGSIGTVVLTSVASSFTSPLPGLYTIGDGTAGYGSVVAGATANCREATGNCFELRAELNVNRFPRHWDAKFVETLETGQAKMWKLHIGASFWDVPVSATPGSFYHYVETLLHSGTTAGCDAVNFCPTGEVSRAQMAMFIARAMAGDDAAVPATGTVTGRGGYTCGASGLSLFTDVAPEAQYCRHVHYVAAHEVTLGCGNGSTFCPGVKVTRLQMAMFISRAMVGGDIHIPNALADPTTGRHYDCQIDGDPYTYFEDAPADSAQCRYPHYLWARGVADGCAGLPHPTFCLTPLVRRDQMAKLLVNGFGLTLYGP